MASRPDSASARPGLYPPACAPRSGRCTAAATISSCSTNAPRTLGLTPARAAALARSPHRHRLRPVHHHRAAAAGVQRRRLHAHPQPRRRGGRRLRQRHALRRVACWPDETGRRHQVIRTVAGNLPADVLAGRPRAGGHGAGAARLAGHPAGAADGHAAPRSRAGAGQRSGGAAAWAIRTRPSSSPTSPRCRSRQLGPALEHDPLFPERANIGFAQVLAPDRIRLRVWERGAGLTLACGSGACAALVNAHRRGLTGRRARWSWTAASWRSNGAPTATC